MEALLTRKYKRRMASIDRKIEEIKELSVPITEKEMLKMLKAELPKMTESNLREHISEKYQNASKNGKELTYWDAYSLKIKIELNHVPEEEKYWKYAVTTQEMRESGETYIIPKQVKLTPLPDFESYDPEELYNMQDDMSVPIRPNLSRQEDWFDKPQVYEPKGNFDMKKYTDKKVSFNIIEQTHKGYLKHEKLEAEKANTDYFKNYERPEKNIDRVVDK